MLFEFFSPVKIIAGDNAIFSLPVQLKALNVINPIIISDDGVKKSNLLKFVFKALKEGGITNLTVFDDIPPETSTTAIKKAKELFQSKNCDGIIAVGGGSVIDSAKALNMLISSNKNELDDLAGANNLEHDTLPFIVIPTTAGTGSEVTTVAVIFDEKQNRKVALADEKILPDAAIIDPVMTMTMPKKLTASSGIDALSHAIEAYISIATNPISRVFATTSISLILDNLMDSIQKQDKTHRFNMALASTLAGIAFSNAMVGINHSLAHATGSVLHIPHGIAVGVYLVESLRYMENSIKSELEQLSVYAQKGHTHQGFIDMIDSFLEKVSQLSGVAFRLKDYLKDENLIDKIAELSVIDGSSIFSKIEFTRDVAVEIIKNSLKR